MQPGREGLHPHAPIGWPIMSDAALTYVAAFTHPLVTAVGHDLLAAIARLIPEGQTTTPVIPMGAIAVEAHLHRRTVWTWLPILVEIGEVRVVDGGHGRPARYTLVHVPGEALPTAPQLPLRADLRPVPRRPRPPSDNLDLFDEKATLVRSDGEAIGFQALFLDPITRITSWLTRITRITSWRSESEELVIRRSQGSQVERSDGEELVIGTCDPCDPRLPLDVAGTRARAVLLLKERTTTTAPPAAEPAATAPTTTPQPERPCRWLGKSHAWCHDRMHVPMDFHLEERAKLPRQPGQSDAELDDLMFAKYAAVMATIPATADLRRYRNQFEFWKEHLRPVASSSHGHQAVKPAAARRRPDIPMVNYCSHQPTCTDGAACVDLMMADFHAKKQRQADVG